MAEKPSVAGKRAPRKTKAPWAVGRAQEALVEAQARVDRAYTEAMFAIDRVESTTAATRAFCRLGAQLRAVQADLRAAALEISRVAA